MRVLLASSVVVLGTLGCGQPAPLPPDRINYAGQWEGDGVRIEISRDARVRYDRKHGAGNEHIEGPIAGWRGDSIVVGVMTQKTTIEVTQPPTLERGTWTMILDGNTVYRTTP